MLSSANTASTTQLIGYVFLLYKEKCNGNETIGVFETLEKAEKAQRNLVRTLRLSEDNFRSLIISQIPINAAISTPDDYVMRVIERARNGLVK